MLKSSRKSFIFMGAVSLLILLSGLQAWSQCTNCGEAQGIQVNNDGTVDVVPVVAGVDVGPGAPGICNAANAPQSGIARNLGSSSVPVIKWGTSRITLDGSGNVLLDGRQVAEWSWNSSTKTLTTSEGYKYVFDNAAGMLTQSTGPNGLSPTTYTYYSNDPDRLDGVTDSFGNTWDYWMGEDRTTFGAFDRENTREVMYRFKSPGSNGAGQYDLIQVAKIGDGGGEQQRAEYEYDSGNRVTAVTVTDRDAILNPPVTHIEYVSGNEGGRTNPVRRVYNTKLKTDTCYDYGTESIAEAYGGAQTYGYTQIRKRATCSTATSYSANDNNNSSDQITRIYYYQDGNGQFDYVYKVVQMVSDGNSGLQPYSTVKYQVYGYLDRFSATPPTYYDVLKGRPWKVVDARGNATTYTYSAANGMVTRIDLPTNDYKQYWYKQIGGVDSAFVEKVRDSRGKYTKYTLDSTYPSLVTKIEVSDDGSTYTTTKEMSYYSSPSQKQGLLYQQTVPDIEGDTDMVTTYDYSETIGQTTYYRRSPTVESYARWNGSAYDNENNYTSYYADGRVRWAKDALNNRTDYSYDDEDRLVDTYYAADPASTGTVGSYTSTTVTDSNKSWRTNELADMTLEITSGTYTGTRYPIVSNTGTVITISGELPDVTSQAYQVRPYGQLHYLSCCGFIDQDRDRRGKKTYYERDSAGRITKVRNDVTDSGSVDPLVKYTYNDLGQVTTSETWKADSTSSRATTYTYDQLGRQVQVTYPGSNLLGTEYYQYDKAGNMVGEKVATNGSAHVTAYKYDELNRLTAVDYHYSGDDTWPINTDSYPDFSANDSYVYDAGSSLVTSRTDAAGTSGFAYDERGRLETYTPPMPSGWTVDYTYNNADDKTSVTVSDGTHDWTTTYGYYKNGWLKSVDGPGGVSVDYSYDEVGQPDKEIYGNGTQAEYSFNGKSQLAGLKHYKTSPHNLLVSSTYVRDNVGNPIEMSWDGGTTATTCTYDAMNRVTTADYPSGTDGSFSYDWIGNRTGVDWGTPNAIDWQGSDPSGSLYGYDAMYGNMDERNDYQTYQYDDYNLLKRIDWYGDAYTTFVSDATGNRVRMHTDDQGGPTYEFVYDILAGIPSVLVETGPGGSRKLYVRAPDGRLIAQAHIASGDAVLDHYYHFDGLGSTRALTNASGTVTDEFSYDVWGKVTRVSGTTEQPYLFVGQLGYYTHYQDPFMDPLDSEIDPFHKHVLLQLGVRYYSPATGRFTQRDPLKDGMNYYAYVNDQPTAGVDPTGLFRLALPQLGDDRWAACYKKCTETLMITKRIPIMTWVNRATTIWEIVTTKTTLCKNGTRITVIATKLVPKTVWVGAWTVTKYVTVVTVGWDSGIAAGCSIQCSFGYYQDYWLGKN
jgi:RHS repeat-associated protein